MKLEATDRGGADEKNLGRGVEIGGGGGSGEADERALAVCFTLWFVSE